MQKAENPLLAVLTGDIIRSRNLPGKEKEAVLSVIKKSPKILEQLPGPGLKLSAFDVFRGDSFQVIVFQPEMAVIVSVMLRTLVKKTVQKPLKTLPDIRIAIGMGNVDTLTTNVSEGDGEAFQRSGLLLDQMPADQKMAIATSSDELDRRWNAELGLLDALVTAWTYPQAEVIPGIMTGQTQQEIADKLHIEQSTIHRRLRAADWPAAERYLAYVAEDIKRSLSIL